jgi:hypothetical protein
MMTEEELKRFRDYASHYQGSDVFFLMKHIDGQANQIAVLKATIMSDRTELVLYSPDFIVWRYQNDIGRIESQDDWKPIEAEAKRQLAQEYPEIAWEEKK